MHHLTLAALVLAMAACGAPAGSRQAPAFTLTDLQGATHSLAGLRGKPVLLNFWATWCESCREEMPALESLHRRLAGKGVVILGASLDENPLAMIPPFARTYGLTFPLVIAERSVVNAYAVRGLPAAFLIDANGRIVRRWVGALDFRSVENDILALLERRP